MNDGSIALERVSSFSELTRPAHQNLRWDSHLWPPATAPDRCRPPSSQTLQPSNVIISCVSSDDARELAARDDLLIVYGHAGAARQRNVVLRNLPPGPTWSSSSTMIFSLTGIG